MSGLGLPVPEQSYRGIGLGFLVCSGFHLISLVPKDPESGHRWLQHILAAMSLFDVRCGGVAGNWIVQLI